VLSFEKDFILRLVAQIAAAIARVLQLKQEKKYDQAEKEIGEAYFELFGIDPRLLPLVQPQALLQSLGHPTRVTAFCGLMAEQADLLALRGDRRGASSLARRALELLEHAPPIKGDAPRRQEVLTALRALANGES
jgi:hypothetical protein